MAIVHSLPSAADGHRRLRLDSPVDQHSLGELDVSTKDDVDGALSRARAAQASWAARPVKERARIVRAAVDELKVKARLLFST